MEKLEVQKKIKKATGGCSVAFTEEPCVERSITLLHCGTKSTTRQQIPRHRQVLPPAIDPWSIIRIGLDKVQTIGRTISRTNLNLRRTTS